MHYAAAGKQATVVQFLLERGADVHAANVRGLTPLHVAAISGDVESIRLLLAAGADANARDREGQTPAHVAVTKDRGEDVLRVLKEGGADLLAVERKGFTCLHVASLRGHVESVKALLVLEPLLTAMAKPGDKLTAMHLAAINDRHEVARCLLCTPRTGQEEVKEFLEMKDRAGRTALHFACALGRYRVAELLLHNSPCAAVDVADKEGHRPIHLALKPDKVSVSSDRPPFAEGYEDGVDSVVLAQVTSAGVPDGLRQRAALALLLVANGANPNAVDGRGCSAFESVCDPELRALLLDAFLANQEGQDVERRKTYAVRKDNGRRPSGSARISQGAAGVEELKARLRDFEDRALCTICLERVKSVAFLCGHQACAECSASLSSCHMCRQPVTKKIFLY